VVLDPVVDQGVPALMDYRVHIRVEDHRGKWSVTQRAESQTPLQALMDTLEAHGVTAQSVTLVKIEPWGMAEGKT
jgi:hypothetical protein